MSNIHTYTVIYEDDGFTHIKEGCCGGTIKVPKALGFLGSIGTHVDVRSTLERGLMHHEVHINGQWVEI